MYTFTILYRRWTLRDYNMNYLAMLEVTIADGSFPAMYNVDNIIICIATDE